MSPPKDLNTTILKLDHLPGQYTTLLSTGSEPPYGEEITVTTPEGKALLEFLISIEEEPGHDYTMWGRIREFEDCLLVFVGNDNRLLSLQKQHINVLSGWDEYPSLPFRSSESLNQMPESSSLAKLRPHLRSPLEVINIAFCRPMATTIVNPQSLSYELLTWVIPSNLDPTCHHNPASQFDELDGYLFRTQSMSATRRRDDLASYYRGWVTNCEAETSAATEPSEKTHVFFFIWKDAEAETRFKNGSLEEGVGESWKENFLPIQQEWEEMGMRTESLHLSLVDFWEQFRWLERDARDKAK